VFDQSYWNVLPDPPADGTLPSRLLFAQADERRRGRETDGVRCDIDHESIAPARRADVRRDDADVGRDEGARSTRSAR